MLDKVATEILGKILKDKCLGVKDLICVLNSSKTLNTAGNSNETWLVKFQQIFPELLKDTKPGDWGQEVCWRDELKKRVEIGREVIQGVRSMTQQWPEEAVEPSGSRGVGRRFGGRLSMKGQKRQDLSTPAFYWLDSLLKQSKSVEAFIPLYVTDELISILTKAELGWVRYIAERCIIHVKHRLLKHQIISFLREEQIHGYEEVLVMIAQWSQPTKAISSSKVARQLDMMSNTILFNLLEINPSHAIFKSCQNQSNKSHLPVSTSFQELARTLPIGFYSQQECEQIVECAGVVFYSVEGFRAGTTKNSPDLFFINKILETKTADQITLCMVFSCLLNRLGVKSVLVNRQQSGGSCFLLHLLDTPDQAEEPEYILDGKLVADCDDVQPEVFVLLDAVTEVLSGISTLDVTDEIISDNRNYLKRSTLELMQITLHNSKHMGLYKQTGAELCKLYMDLDINHEKVIDLLQELRFLPESQGWPSVSVERMLLKMKGKEGFACYR